MLTIIKKNIYSQLYSMLFLPLAIVRILSKAYKNPQYLNRFSERLAIYDKKRQLHHSYDIWFHTVSVGEFIAAKSLISKVEQQYPHIKILITTTTPTGSKLVVDFINKKNNISHVYYPYDVKFICNRFIKKFQPKVAVYFETELWPVMYQQLQSHGIKLCLLNARLSEKSFIGYSKYKYLLENIINKIDFVAAQSNYDKERFKLLGFHNQIETYGNIKYNLILPNDIKQTSAEYKKLLGMNHCYFIAASTHKGEEQQIIKVYQSLKEQYSNLKLIIAPRHPERFNDVVKLAEDDNLQVVRYTQIDPLITMPVNKFDVFIVDTIGKLLYFYNMSDIVFIGGSLVDIGGHNPIEPAILKKPVIIGPYYHNFKQIVAELVEYEGIIKINNSNELHSNMLSLLNNVQHRDTIANSAFTAVQQHQKALDKYLELISKYLDNQKVNSNA